MYKYFLDIQTMQVYRVPERYFHCLDILTRPANFNSVLVQEAKIKIIQNAPQILTIETVA